MAQRSIVVGVLGEQRHGVSLYANYPCNLSGHYMYNITIRTLCMGPRDPVGPEVAGNPVGNLRKQALE